MTYHELKAQVKVGKGLPDLALIAINAYAGFHEASGNPLPQDVLNAFYLTTFSSAAGKGNYSGLVEAMDAGKDSNPHLLRASLKGTLQGGLLIAPADILIGRALGYAAYAATKYI